MAKQTYLLLTDTTIDSSGTVYSPVLDANLWDFSKKGAVQYEFDSTSTGNYAICSLGMVVSLSNGGTFHYAKDTGMSSLITNFIGYAACTGAFSNTAAGIVNFDIPVFAPYVKVFVKSTTDTSVILDKLYLSVNEDYRS